MNLTQFDPFSLVLFVAAMSLLPLLFICTTCFLKVSMILMIVRNAIGVQQVPPSMAINSIALAITMFVMAPIFQDVFSRLPKLSANAYEGTRSFNLDDLVKAAEPLRKFMTQNTLPEQRQRFLALAQQQAKQSNEKLRDTDYVVLIPTFVISEIELAFRVGFVLYIPFVVIDLLISNLLLALGMQMVSPMAISIPLKLLLFVVLDGWARLFEGLVNSYG